LSIAYRIIKEHGGTITVASEPEVGTKFTIKIPAMSSSETRKGQ
jgi:signal transduction histidine kinase